MNNRPIECLPNADIATSSHRVCTTTRMIAASRRLAMVAALGLCIAHAAAQELIDLPDYGDSAGAVISPEQERRIGENFMREMRRQAPMVDDEEIEDYIQELGHSLSDHGGYYGEFNFYVVDSPVVNAFAVPGGFIFFHTGLILETQSEAELASVVAHEISHITQRHAARMLEQAAQMQMPTIAAMIGSIALAIANPQAGMAAMMTTQAAAVQGRTNFTRANEQEADAMGIRLMSDAGYDTAKMAVFFERMQRANRFNDPAFIPEYLRTHPITVNRIAEARGRAESVKPAVVREDNYKYALVKAKLLVRAARDPVEAQQFFQNILGKGDFESAVVARYGLALALARAGDFSKARIEFEKLASTFPTLVPFRIAAAQLEDSARDYAAALENYHKAYELEPDNRAAVYGYVNALITVGRADEGKRLLRGYALDERRDPKFYKLQAEAETRLGETANAHHSLAEYYLAIGAYAQAAEQLRIASATPELSNYQRQKIAARLEEVEKTILALENGRRR